MNDNTLASAVKETREKINMSQWELSRITGIDNNAIVKIKKVERKKLNVLSLKKVKFSIKSFFREDNGVMWV